MMMACVNHRLGSPIFGTFSTKSLTIFPESIPEPSLNLAVYLGAIVAWVTDHAADPDPHTNVPCRRSPGRRRCRGEIFAELDATSKEIVWQCPLCGDRGVVYGWEGTFWDRRGPVQPAGL
jgi:hypothetical protein